MNPNTAAIRNELASALAHVRRAIALADPKKGAKTRAERLIKELEHLLGVRLAANLDVLDDEQRQALVQDQPTETPYACRVDRIAATVAARAAKAA